ncbi:expressed unknown protein [Ectocarpus siliculosus]|uniref:Uncharacterized protein n=1 Tax=Ectocarpus siliculosus TaxID=2880 RepID=D8LDA3_ECTSI|nr:expressed unknown protein [Ectocarpus siliculosus]|eukprot:CBN80161.1 expressed unknown protein [Ectocarpus siliculosus]
MQGHSTPQPRTKSYDARQRTTAPLPRKPWRSGQGLRATNPRELERFVDSSRDGIECVGVGRESRLTARTSTATSISWDGLTLDPRPFARFDEHNTLTTGKKPAGSAGARVMVLEGHAPGGIFGRPVTGPGRMQWTVEQETSRVMAPDNPFRRATVCGGGVNVERPFFDSALAVVPKVQAVRPPTCLSRAGPQGDRALLAPEERREINDYDTKMQNAERVGRKARHQKTRLDFILKHRYPEGAIGVDSPSNPTSEVHAETRLTREKKEAASSAHASARRHRLDDIRGDPRPRFGYDPWQHPDLPAGGGIQQGVFGGVTAEGGGWGAIKQVGGNGGEHFLQTKTRKGSRQACGADVPPAGSRIGDNMTRGQQPSAMGHARSETFINILGMRQKIPKSDPRVRAQALWDEGCGRRSYNIVTGVQLPLPSVKAERPPGRLAHPSQQSLERGRNLQASLIAA